MIRNGERQPLPGPNDYLEAVVSLSRKLNIYGDVPLAINKYTERVQRKSSDVSQLMVRYAYLGLCLEQLDPQTGAPVNKHTPSARAFSYGVVAGTMIAETTHKGIVTPNSIYEAMAGFSLSQSPDDTEPEDEVQTRHEIAGQVLERGKDGLELMGPAAERILEELECTIEPDITKQVMFRIGCGLIALDAFTAHRAVNIAKDNATFDELMADVDIRDTDFDAWDADFTK